jgi:hypothetical protein
MTDVSRQKAEGVRVGGAVNQHSDVASTEQSVANSTVRRDLRQTIASERQSLNLGRGMSASGRWAVVALLIIAIVWIAYKLWTSLAQ